MEHPDQSLSYQRYRGANWEHVDASIIRETPVSITVNGEIWLTTMCTPTHLEALAAGFIFNEGAIQSSGEIDHIRVCPTGDNVDIWLKHAAARPSGWRRTSGCGGGATSVASSVSFDLSEPGQPLSPDQILTMMGQLYQSQDLYRETGGVHTSALSDGERILLHAEDIGRHNTLDKLSGRILLEGIHPEMRVLLTTGRISSEMLQKAARIRAHMLVSRTSPSSLSVQLARQWGITLIGYARRDQFSVYAHPERIRTSPVEEAA